MSTNVIQHLQNLSSEYQPGKNYQGFLGRANRDTAAQVTREYTLSFFPGSR